MTAINVVGGIPLLRNVDGELAGYKDATGSERGILSTPTPGIHYGPIVLAQSAVAVSLTGSLAETELGSVTVPGGLMGKNGALRVTLGTTQSANINAKTISVKLGGTVIAQISAATNAAASAIAVICANRNAENSQYTRQDGTIAAATVSTTSAVDTAVDQELTITGALGVSLDTLTLEAFTVEVLPA